MTGLQLLVLKLQYLMMLISYALERLLKPGKPMLEALDVSHVCLAESPSGHLPVVLELADFDQRPSLDLILLVVAVNVLPNALPEGLDCKLSDADGSAQQSCYLVVDLQQTLKGHPRPPAG